MPTDSAELSLLSLFSISTFFIFLVIKNLSKKIGNGILLDQAIARGQAMVCVQKTQLNGIPVDNQLIEEFNKYWPDVKNSVIQRVPNIPNIRDKPSMNKIINNNAVNRNLINSNLLNGVQCNLYCLPLLILVVIVTCSVLSSLCVDIFKNKQITLNILNLPRTN